MVVSVVDSAIVTGAEGDCTEPSEFTLTTEIIDLAGDDGTGGEGYIDEGDTEEATVTLAILTGAQGCQGATFAVTVTFTAAGQ